MVLLESSTVAEEAELIPEQLQRAGRWLGPILFLGLLSLPAPTGLPLQAWHLLAVTTLMAIWWFTQAIPIAVTSLLPIALFPLLGICNSDTVSQSYIDRVVWLYLGGFVVALGIEKWGLHRRIALIVLSSLGTSPHRIVLGFMLATGGLSMWISNTAATLMMLPIAMALLKTLEDLRGAQGQPVTTKSQAAFATALVLGIAYAASIGGTMSPIGTPTNLALMGIWKKQFPEGPPIHMADWILAFVPVGLAMLSVTWAVLTYRISGSDAKQVHRGFFRDQLRQLGPISRGEGWMLGIFLLTASLWVFLSPFEFAGVKWIPGWSEGWQALMTRTGLAPGFEPKFLHESTVAIAMTCVMFLIPVRKNERGSTEFLMDWKTANQLPWDLILLFGGGFALAEAFETTKLAQFLAEHLPDYVPTKSWLVWVLVVNTVMTFLTEFTSNVAVANIFMPILAGLAVSLGFDPRLILLPGIVSTSFAFMLPVGTPPNAIVFGTGRVRMDQMIRTGFVINLIGILIMTVATAFWVIPVLGLQTSGLPGWVPSK